MNAPESLFAVLADDGHLAHFDTTRSGADEQAESFADDFGGIYTVVEYVPHARLDDPTNQAGAKNDRPHGHEQEPTDGG